MKPKSLGDLLRETRESNRLSIDAAAEKLEVNKNTVGAYERGERLPDVDYLSMFALVMGISFAQLLALRMQASEQREVRAASRSLMAGLARKPGNVVEQDRADYVYIPLYDVKAAAGHGKVVEAEPVKEVLAFRSDWLRQELQATPADVRLLFVAGDSMEPDLRAGDIVMIDIRDTGASFEGYYVLRLDGALLVKQLQRLPGGVLEVSSRNQAYKPFTVKMAELEEGSEFAIIGRVVWACRRV